MDYAYLYAAKRGDPSGAILHSRATRAGGVLDNIAHARRNDGNYFRTIRVDWVEKDQIPVSCEIIEIHVEDKFLIVLSTKRLD